MERERGKVEEILSGLRRIMRVQDVYSRRLVQRFGLTGPQLAVLRELGERAETTPGQLAGTIRLSNATVTGILDRLAARGIVLRRRSSNDRRKVWVSLTDVGVELLSSSPSPFEARFLDEFAHLEGWEQSQLVASIQRLAALMECGVGHSVKVAREAAVAESSTVDAELASVIELEPDSIEIKE